MCESDIQNPTTIRIAANALGVTEAWLRQECEAGRLPHLRAGRSILLDLPLVRRILRERAQQIPDPQGEEHCRKAALEGAIGSGCPVCDPERKGQP